MIEFTDFAFPATGAPTSRTLPTRLKDVVNVKDFGATGDGDTDDRQAIQDAIDWKSDWLTLTADAYSGAFRASTTSWSSAAGGTLTVNFTEPHGWAGPTVVVEFDGWSTSGGTSVANFDTTYTATVIDADTITIPTGRPGPVSDPEMIGYRGSVRPTVTGAVWAANVLTLTFSEAHRYATGVSCIVAGFTSATVNGTRTIASTPTTTTLTFAVTGSGSMTVMGTCKPVPILTVASVPSTISPVTAAKMGAHNPTFTAGGWQHPGVQSVTSTTMNFGTIPLQNHVAAGTEVRIHRTDKGTVFFPPGDYYIGGPLYFDGSTEKLLGVPGKSVIRGDFSGYLFNQNLKVGVTGPVVLEKLTWINENASGGGVQLTSVVCQVRDCMFEANKCLNFSSEDYLNAVSFSVVVNGCIFKPGAHTSGSIGIILATNNCSMNGCWVVGFDEGIRPANFGKTICGNVFEDNGIAVNMGISPTGTNYVNSYSAFSGNTFINNGTGYYLISGGSARFEGNYIEGGPDAAYGLRRASNSGNNLIRGLDIAGDFTTAAYSEVGGDATTIRNVVQAVRAVNDTGTDWSNSVTAHCGRFVECNDPRLYTYSLLNGRALASATWSAGTVTLTTHATHPFVGGFTIHVRGVMVGGSTNNKYNGVFTASGGGTTITYSLPVNPGSATASTGSVQGARAGSSGRPLKAISWAGGTVSAETWPEHQIGAGSTVTVAGVKVGGSAANDYNTTLTVDEFTVTGIKTFIYPVTLNPGTADDSCLPDTVPEANGTTATASVSHMDGMNSSFSVGESTTQSITDGAKLGGGTAVIGDRIQGSGSQRIKVRWTQQGWIRCG